MRSANDLLAECLSDPRNKMYIQTPDQDYVLKMRKKRWSDKPIDYLFNNYSKLKDYVKGDYQDPR